jgi:hypothetical protein
MQRRSRSLAIALLAGTLAPGGVAALPFVPDPILPDFGAATFIPGAPIDNPYLPLVPGTFYKYRGEKLDSEGELEVETVKVRVTADTKLVNGVLTTVVLDEAFENGVLVERTFDYFAQDTVGNVWYLGEDVTNFELDADGNVIGTNDDGAWQAGQNGALPGITMLASPLPGDNYYQELAVTDEALDQAEVLSLDESLSIALGTFDDVLRSLEFSELEPQVFEIKSYVQGIGLAFIEAFEQSPIGLDDPGPPDFTVALIGISTVPEPGTLALLASGLLTLAARPGRRRARG